MRLLVPIIPNPAAPLARANPVAKLAAALVIMAALFASLDAVTAGVVLVGLVALLPVAGLPVRPLLARLWLVGIVAISIGVFNVLFAAEQVGPTVAGPWTARDRRGDAGKWCRPCAAPPGDRACRRSGDRHQRADRGRRRADPAAQGVAALRHRRPGGPPPPAPPRPGVADARRGAARPGRRGRTIAGRRRAPVRRQAPVAARRGHSARSEVGAGHGGAWLRGACPAAAWRARSA